MTATVTDLLSRRESRHQPGLHFDTDWQALAYAAEHLDELRQHVASSHSPDAEQIQLQLAQAASIVRACMRVHGPDREWDNQ